MVIAVDGVESRVDRSEQNVRQRFVAIRGVRVRRVEWSAGPDWNRVNVVRQLLVVTPVAGVPNVHRQVPGDRPLDVDAGVLSTVPRNVTARPHV